MDNRDVYREIKSGIKIEDYARKSGYTVVKKGRYFSLKEHDSVMIDPVKNCFWRNSEPGMGRAIGKGGSIIDFVCEMEGVTLHEALKKLTAEIHLEGLPKFERPRQQKPKEVTGLELPPEDTNMRNVFAYLIKTRKIAQKVVQSFVDRKMLYQDQNKNCVFVSYDQREPEKAVFGCRRGTNTYHPFYGDLKGCDYRQCFFYGNRAKRLYIAESVIDIMSVMSLKADREQFDYLALAGVGKWDVLDTYLPEKRYEEIWIGTDQDTWGRQAAALLKERTTEKRPDVKVIMDLPEEGYKDWNDVLKGSRKG